MMRTSVGRRAASSVASAAAIGISVASLAVGAVSAQAALKPGVAGCVGQSVTVDARGRIGVYDIDGTARGAQVTRRGTDGTLGYTPQAFAFAGEAGDISGGARTHFVVTPAGRMHRVAVVSRMDKGKYVASLHTKSVGRGFAPKAMAAQVDPMSEDSGFVYVVDRAGALRRHGYSEGAGLGRGVKVATGLRDVRELDFSRFVSKAGADGMTETVGDVLLATDARTGALREIVVPYAAPAKTRVATLAPTGWGRYAQVQRLNCNYGTGGLVAFDEAGRGTVFNDPRPGDLKDNDIVKVGSVTGPTVISVR